MQQGTGLLVVSILASSVSLSHGHLWSGGVALVFAALVCELAPVLPDWISATRLSVLLEVAASVTVFSTEVDNYAVLGLVLALACLGEGSSKK